MSMLDPKWIPIDDQSLQVLASELAVLPDPDGALERTATGLNVKDDSIGPDQLTDAVAILSEDETVTGSWVFDEPITVAAATAPTHAATLAQVNAAIEGLKSKGTVRVVADADVASLSGTTTIDGVALVADDLVLLTDQTDGTENGAWVVKAGAWQRPSNFAAGSDAANAIWSVSEGTTYGDTRWWVTDGEVVNTDALTVERFTTSADVIGGDGLTQSGNTLAVGAGHGIAVTADDVTVDLDGGTLSKSVDGLKVAAAGITHVEIASAALGTSLSGGSGTVLNVAVAQLIDGGSHPIDADKLEVSYAGLGYTPATESGITDATDQLTSHLKGIGTALVAKKQRKVQVFTLDATAMANKYVTLASVPVTANEVTCAVKGGPGQHYGDDFQMHAINTDRLTWSGLGLDGQLISGDKLTVTYSI